MSLPIKGNGDDSLVFEQIRSDLECMKKELSNSAYSRSKSTTDNMEKIHKNISKITDLKSDDLRNREINNLTKGGAEDGFSSNPQVLAERINIFRETYLKSKEAGDLEGFFSCFSKGDPCLSGRTESLYKYAATLDGIDIDLIPDPEKKLFLPGMVFSEIIMEHFEENVESGIFSSEDLADHVTKNLKSVSEEFAEFEKSESGQSFLEFLDVIGIYQKGDEVNWERLIGKLVQSRSFEAVFNHSMTCVI